MDIKDVKNIVASAANRIMGKSNSQIDDAIQEGFMYWWNRRNKHNPERGTESAYIYRCARWGIKKWLQCQQPLNIVKVARTNWSAHLDKQFRWEFIRWIEKAAPKKDLDDALDLQRAIAGFDVKDTAIIAGMLEDKNNEEIAEMLVDMGKRGEIQVRAKQSRVDGIGKWGVAKRWNNSILPKMRERVR